MPMAFCCTLPVSPKEEPQRYAVWGVPVRSLLTTHKLSELVAKGKKQALTILRSSATVDEALRALSAAKVLSCPVVTPDEPKEGQAAEKGASQGPQWPADAGGVNVEGFVDSRELLTLFLSEVDAAALAGSSLLHRMRVLEDKGLEFAERKLSDLKDMGKDGDFLHTSQSNCTLLEFVSYVLLDPRARGLHEGKQSGTVHPDGRCTVHRVALFDKQGRITHIVSQTDLIKFLAQHTNRLGPLATATVEELGMVNHKVRSVPVGSSALEAMQLMAQHNISSVAVVDANGALLGNFSMSDLRSIIVEQLGALALPVGEFLALEHHTEYVDFNRTHEEGVVGSKGHKFVTDHVTRKRPPTPGAEVGQALVECRATTTFGEVVELLAKHRIHRVYVIDDERKPVGIITCTDVLRKTVELAQAAT